MAKFAWVSGRKLLTELKPLITPEAVCLTGHLTRRAKRRAAHLVAELTDACDAPTGTAAAGGNAPACTWGRVADPPVPTLRQSMLAAPFVKASTLGLKSYEGGVSAAFEPPLPVDPSSLGLTAQDRVAIVQGFEGDHGGLGTVLRTLVAWNVTLVGIGDGATRRALWHPLTVRASQGALLRKPYAVLATDAVEALRAAVQCGQGENAQKRGSGWLVQVRLDRPTERKLYGAAQEVQDPRNAAPRAALSESVEGTPFPAHGAPWLPAGGRFLNKVQISVLVLNRDIGKVQSYVRA